MPRTILIIEDDRAVARLLQDALQYAYDRGLILVAASGNENGPQARFPGSDARTLCVGGSNRSDERKRVGDASSEAWCCPLVRHRNPRA